MLKRFKNLWGPVTDAQRRQTILPPPEQAQWTVAVGRHAAILAPRPDWAPPASVPGDWPLFYISGSAEAAAVVAVKGGDGYTDWNASIIAEGGAPIELREENRAYLGASTRDELTGTWQALCLALMTIDATMAQGGCAIIRIPYQYRRQLTGLRSVDQPHQALEDKARELWRDCNRRGQVFVSGWRQQAGYTWGERARAITQHCGTQPWGTLPTRWDGIPRLPQIPGTGDTCAICFEPFDDPLPRPTGNGQGPTSVAQQGRHMFACQRHATCVECDEYVCTTQPWGRCPLCRADRVESRRRLP